MAIDYFRLYDAVAPNAFQLGLLDENNQDPLEVAYTAQFGRMPDPTSEHWKSWWEEQMLRSHSGDLKGLIDKLTAGTSIKLYPGPNGQVGIGQEQLASYNPDSGFLGLPGDFWAAAGLAALPVAGMLGAPAGPGSLFGGEVAAAPDLGLFNAMPGGSGAFGAGEAIQAAAGANALTADAFGYGSPTGGEFGGAPLGADPSAVTFAPGQVVTSGAPATTLPTGLGSINTIGNVLDKVGQGDLNTILPLAGAAYSLFSGTDKPPQAPNPMATVGQQRDANIQTAIANYLLQNANTSTPYGTTTTRQTGSYTIPGINGQPGFTVPTFQRDFAFTPRLQGMFENVQSGLQQPFSLTGVDAAQNKAEGLLLERVNRELDVNRRAREAQLANQGIGLGSSNYAEAQSVLGNQENQARQDAILGAFDLRPKLIAEEQNIRQMPLNEFNSLLTGNKTQPSWTGTTIQAPDITGASNQDYQNTVNAWNFQQAADQQKWNNVFQFGGMLLGNNYPWSFGGKQQQKLPQYS